MGGVLFVLASWWCNGLPRRWCIAGVKARTATLKLKHGLDSLGEAAVTRISQCTKVWWS